MLVVEDNQAASLYIEDILDRLGCVVIGPFPTMPEAREAAKTQAIDLALLDVNLAGVLSYPVAQILDERNIPFILLTAYGEHGVPSDHPEWPWHSKPFVEADLVTKLRDMVPAA